MLKMSTQIETIVNAYKTLSKIPSIVGGKISNNGKFITSKWSVRNLDKGKHSKYTYNYVLDDSFKVVAESNFGTDVSNELLSSVSPRETFKAVIREERDKDAKKQYLEVWSKESLAHSIDLTALDLHGDVYSDSEFGSLDWSPDEGSVVYVAEKKPQKSEPYIKRKGEEKAKSDGSGEAAPKKGEEYLYRQDWGEQLVGKHLSVIVVCRIESETFSVLEGLPDTWCPGQVRFSADGRGVAGVAWQTEPRRLGLIFCTNRPGWIFQLALDGKMSKISAEGAAVRSPRLSPSGDLVWLQRPADGPHHACHAVMTRKKDQTTTSTVVDIVQTSVETANKVSFHGVYATALPGECFSADGTRLVFSTSQKNEVRAYVADIDGGRIVDISIKDAPGSTSILDVKNDVVLAAFSSITIPGQLYVARLPARGSEASIKWVRVSKPIEVPASVAATTVEYLDLTHKDSQDAVKSFNALYVAPKLDGKLPLIVWPHGGPHSNFVNSFAIETAFYSMLGFASVQVNFRGSTGSGQASVQFLPSRVGDADVIDCKLATDEAVKRYAIDNKRIVLTGGSHGGFLVTHLSGQYPDLYAAVVTRNPVTDVASMFNSTDIADWCAVEAGFPFSEKGEVSEQQLLSMRRCSPLAHAHKVRAPTALLLGTGDKRVPHFQGLEFARRLKANGVITRIYMYDDNHSLSSLPHEMDHLINGASWFFEHLDK